tara:strand:- start:225 stop:431 length:207 start_codon:yes stop_codon:yes gene_type:complete
MAAPLEVVVGQVVVVDIIVAVAQVLQVKAMKAVQVLTTHRDTPEEEAVEQEQQVVTHQDSMVVLAGMG